MIKTILLSILATALFCFAIWAALNGEALCHGPANTLQECITR